MICPMLSALKPTDDNGQPVNRECIYEECRFFNVEQRDCNLMMASRAMLLVAGPGAPRASATPGVTGAELLDMERRLTELGKGLLHSSLEVQGVVREAGHATIGRVAEAGDSLSRQVAEIAARLGAGPQELESRLATSLQELESRVMAGRMESETRLSERLQACLGEMQTMLQTTLAPLQARLDEQSRGVGVTAAATSQSIEQLQSIGELQQKIADRVLEELALVSATSAKLEQAVASLDKKMDRAADESMQISQLMTLVKGQAERTHAAMRSINEGNRSVIQAIETQLKRDQADLSRRAREEAQECNNRGVALYYRGAFEAAQAAFRQAIHLLPDYAEAHNNLGLVLSKMGQEAEAVQVFQEALRLDPAMSEVYNNLGFLYHTTSHFDRAVEMFGQAIQNSSDSAVAYANLGNSLYKMKQPAKAVEAWRRALELDPMNEPARRSLRMFQQDTANN
ncbi:MAG TPA: tetratricopeptide repeat protein [Candidatus Polarisedimenticolia bacterium]|jgi:tetratricopeptide (TPR) repeat protein|nr:tetratricopeptide repeat protein [Candidatus Polarisedimenticolia bacterium]